MESGIGKKITPAKARRALSIDKCKFETRNPKFETISNDQKGQKVSSEEWQVTRNFPSTPDPRPSFLSDFGF